MISLIISILIGAFVGWLAGLIMKSSHGFLMSALLGIVGSALGHFLAGLIGIGGSGIGGFLISLAGACILIAIVRAILGKKF